MAQTKIVDLLLLRGVTSAADLREALQVSRPTLSRLVAGERSLLRLGRARATRYALARGIAGLPARLPVYRIDSAGKPAQVAVMVPIASRGTWIEPEKEAGHLHEGLPPVVVDMAPAGYLGRRFADRNPALELPLRLEDWSDDHRLIALARRGEDAPGDLIIGEESLDRFLAQSMMESRPRDYPRLAEESAEGGAGSSAGGEQTKFTAFRAGRHYLVKFTNGDRSPSDLRWRDLLVCESIALEELSKAGVLACRARVLDVGERRFLEVERFDRIGARGRRGVLSLGPLDDDLFGQRDNWSDAANRLLGEKLIDAESARRIRLLEAVAMATSNTDRHSGNLSFFADGLQYRPPLELAPVYDMLPMSAAPRAGVVRDLPEPESLDRAKFLDVAPAAREIAHSFWERAASDTRISRDFRKAASRRAASGR